MATRASVVAREKEPRLRPFLVGGRVATSDLPHGVEKRSRLLEEVLGVAFDATRAIVHATAVRLHVVEEPTEFTRNLAGLNQLLAEKCLHTTVRLGG